MCNEKKLEKSVKVLFNSRNPLGKRERIEKRSSQ